MKNLTNNELKELTTQELNQVSGGCMPPEEIAEVEAILKELDDWIATL